MKKSLFVILLLIPTAFAQLQISGFMYDPSGADTGYEWVELYNPTNQSLSLQNYSLWAGNGANQNDWTLRYNGSPSVVHPGHYFLLGESYISHADEIRKLGLQNAPDGVRLDYINQTVEVIGWGDHEYDEYYQNESLKDISSKAYVRINSTGINSVDFESRDDFFPRNSYYNESIISDSDDAVTVIYDVMNYQPDCQFVQFENEDMSHEKGLQLYSFSEMMVQAVINISDNNGIHDISTIHIDDEATDFFLNSTDISYLYDAQFLVKKSQRAGIYTHSFSVTDSVGETSNDCQIYYEILPMIGIESESVTYMTEKNNSHHNASIVLTNTGNVPLLVTITIEDITQFGLSVAFKSLEVYNSSLPVQVPVPVNSTMVYELVGKPSFGLRAGSYAATLSFIAHDAS